MTCIVGVVDKGRVWMGGDSAGTDYESLSIVSRADRKVFINGPYIIGFTDSFRMGQLLQYKFDPPKPHDDEDLMGFMVTDFIDSARQTLTLGGFSEKKNEVETGGQFLVGYNGRLFQIFGDYQVGESTHGYDACGCGFDLALGALYANAKTKMDAKKRVVIALEAAGHFSAGVRPPYHVLAG